MESSRMLETIILCLYGSGPERLGRNINIPRPNDSAILDGRLEEQGRIKELDEGFFIEKGLHIKNSFFSILKDQFQGIIVTSFYADYIK
jgi:hypothetical protein